MARQENGREDLMAEARNFVERCELRVPNEEQPVIAGFRRDGRMSVYFGQDPVYHFDTAGRLRRAFVADELYKAEWGRLVRLTRDRTAEATYLKRHEMSEQETNEWLQRAERRLHALGAALVQNRHELLRQVPDDATVVARVRETVAKCCQEELTLAASARSL